MYGLWLFKEIKTEYGYCKVEIYRRGYNGSQIEIGALSADSLNISLENLSAITDPIGKSVCSFSIIDTDQINYEDFFTPDATAFKVVVSTMVRGANSFTTRWSGFLTPDFFAENLSYRTPISLTARDNIGYLNDVDFDMPDSTVTVRQLIQAAFAKISDNYPMNLAFVSQKQTAEGVLAIDATISTALLREMSWYEAVETILHDLGLQMRWVDNNTIAVMDLSQIPEYYATQGFNFINASGYREILPAWREFRQEQNYGAFDNFYRGQINGADKLEYAANSDISANVLLYQPAAKTQWAREGAIYFLNLFNSYNQYIDDNKAESIYVTGIAPTATNAEVLATKMVYSQDVTQVNKQIELKFNLNDTLRTPVESLYTRGEYNVFYLPYSTQTGGASGGVSQIKTPRPYQLKYRFNIFLRCKDGSNYVMREDWVDASTVNTEQPFIEFTTEKLKTANTNISDGQGNKRFVFTGYNNDEEYTITINSIPKTGVLEFVVYPWTFEGEDTAREADTYQRGAKISDIQFAVKLNTTGIVSGTLVGESHNVKSNYDYQFGQVPKFDGDLIAYAGGLFYGDTLTAINGFQRNADSTNYNLLELVGREVIHFNKKNYNKLSGTIKNLDKEPLMFNRLFVREGKTYAPFAYSLNVISNEMNITTMQEVEPYDTASFTQIESEVTTGGATVSGGNNTVLQYSEDAGNAKRVFELNTATEAEKNDGYLLLDNPSFGEAKKVHISEVKDTQLRAEVEDLRADFDNLNNLLNDDTSGVIDTWNNVVDFLEGYKDSEDLATILSGINAAIADRALKTDLTALATTVGGLADTLATEQGYIDTLQGYFENGVAKKATADALGNVITDTYATKVALNAVDKRVQTLEALGLSLEVKDGVTYVKSKYSFYTLGGLASGEPSSSGGGGGTVGGSNVSFKAELLSGTKIGTITIDNVATNIYAPSALANPYALTINGTTYDGSSPVDITISGGSGGVSGDYLPLGGGTITSAYETPLYINTSSTQSRITFQVNGTNKSLVGYNPSYGAWMYNFVCNKFIGLKDDGTPFYYDTAERTLIHSGNIGSQSVNYASSAGDADTLGGLTLRDFVQFKNDSTSIFGAFTNIPIIKTSYVPAQGGDNCLVQLPLWAANSSDKYYTAEIRTILNQTPAYRTVQNGTATDWRYFAFTDSNVASATKLQTARTIWGQSFDGTSNVDGVITTMLVTASSVPVIKFSGGEHFDNWGNFCFGENSGTWSVRNSTSLTTQTYLQVVRTNGNVLIGATEDKGHKLAINRVLSSLSATTLNNSGFFVGAVGSYGTNFWTTGDGYGHIQQGRTDGSSTMYPLCLQEFGGNVLIGATSGSSDAKLYVAGNFEATGGVASRQPSDRRLKENICTISTIDAVSVLRKLNPISFKWNALATSLDSRNTGDSVGFIADEYEGLIVNSGRDIWEKYRAIDYTKAIPYLAKGWQVHDAILVKHADNIEDLRARVEVLESENRELKQRLNMRA